MPRDNSKLSRSSHLLKEQHNVRVREFVCWSIPVSGNLNKRIKQSLTLRHNNLFNSGVSSVKI
uniref:Uncharacterized protein n=1 Tax=Rhizophora mucronata TaxID=61149 RepID=A0A2P2J0T8_RHIMU